MNKKQRRTGDGEMNSYVDYFRRLFNRGASMREVVEYGLEKKHLSLPKTKSQKAMLIQRFTRAQRRQMSFDDVLGQSYNRNICYLVGDEPRWIKQDDAALKNSISNSHLKRTIALGILIGIERNRRHWNRSRPAEEQMEQPEYDFLQEILWALNQPKEKQDTGTEDN